MGIPVAGEALNIRRWVNIFSSREGVSVGRTNLPLHTQSIWGREAAAGNHIRKKPRNVLFLFAHSKPLLPQGPSLSLSWGCLLWAFFWGQVRHNPMVMPRCSLVVVLPWCHAKSGGCERAVSPLRAKRGASAGCCFQGGVEVATKIPTGPAGLVDIPLLHRGGEESYVSLQHQCCCSPKAGRDRTA